MRWHSKWTAKDTDTLYEIAFRSRSTPQALLDRPVVGLDLHIFIEAYLALNASRQIGFGGPQPIGMESLAVYYQMTPLTDWDEYLEIVQAMDMAFLDEFAKRSKSTKNGKCPPLS